MRILPLALTLALVSPLAVAQSSGEAGGDSSTSSQAQTTDPLGPSVFLSINGEQAFRVSDWLGAPVSLKDGDEVGEIESLILGPDGQTVAAIIGVGGFLGVGEKEVAVNIKSLTARYEDGAVALDLDATREQIDQAEPVLLD